MNKFTLRFKETGLEQDFQIIFQQKINLRVFLCLSFVSIFLLLLKVIDGLINKTQTQFWLKAGVLCFLVVQLAIVARFKQLARQALLATNYCMMVFQYNLKLDDPHHTYLFGGNQMVIHCLIMLTIDFPDASFSNATLTLVRILLARLNSNRLDYQDYTYAALVAILLQIGLYVKNQQLRKLYMLKIQDNLWDFLMSKIITKPLFMLKFDQEQLKFDLVRAVKLDFLSSEETGFRHFLKEALYLNKPLESYLYDLVQGNYVRKNSRSVTAVESSTLSVLYKKQKKSLTVTQFYVEQLIIILTLESDDTNLLRLQEQFSVKMVHQVTQFERYLIKSTNVLSKSIQQKSLSLLQSLKLANLEQLCVYDCYKSRVRSIDFIALLRKIGQQFSFHIEHKIKRPEELQIVTLKPLMIILIMEIFKHIDKKIQRPFIKLEKLNDLFYLSIVGNFSYPQSLSFGRAVDALIKSYSSFEQTYIFVFKREPQLSYFQFRSIQPRN